tara:strand:+ start:231 stop:398 length:168 start_codon:yes stop_codon:yes gene_type:complete
MSSEARLARGKANYEAGKFLNNSETLAYTSTLKVEKPKEQPKTKQKETKNAKSAK